MSDGPLKRLRAARPTVRLRLTLLYGALFVIFGAVLLVATNILVRSATSNPTIVRDANGGIRFSFETTEKFVQAPGPGEGTILTIAPTTVFGSPAGSLGDRPQEIGPDDVARLALQQHAAEQQQLAVWSAIALAVMAVASVAISWLVAGRVLKPLRTITSDVRAISATNLHRRLSLTGPDDEIRDLGTTFNDLLRRLESSFQAQRLFVANASHELRTPLARQRTLLQVALDDPELTLDSLRATGRRVLVAGEQQERLVEALFTLALAERGLERREPLDLAEVTHAVLAARRTEIEQQGVRVDARLEPSRMSADARLVEQLVANLVDNAARYNIADGQIEVTTAPRGNVAVLRVSNTGPVVPASEIDRLFEPFQRMRPDRTQTGQDGWGLGLSIVRAIAAAHNASVSAEARSAGGLTVEVVFPPAS